MRLLAASLVLLALTLAPFGDALGNMRGWSEGAVGASILYDAQNRVSVSQVTGQAPRSFAYDSRGNATGVGGMTFAYDATNQPTAVSGSVSASYLYDGNLKCVKEGTK